MALGVAGLVIALVVLWLALKRWAPGSVRVRSRRSRLLEVTARLTLDPRKHVYIVKAAGEYVLVGASESGVQLLKVLSADAIQRDEHQTNLETGRPVSSFLAALIEAKRPTAAGPG
jgi:flagellar biogenesis protein FliO